eukprot:gene49998-45044_t
MGAFAALRAAAAACCGNALCEQAPPTHKGAPGAERRPGGGGGGGATPRDDGADRAARRRGLRPNANAKDGWAEDTPRRPPLDPWPASPSKENPSGSPKRQGTAKGRDGPKWNAILWLVYAQGRMSPGTSPRPTQP